MLATCVLHLSPCCYLTIHTKNVFLKAFPLQLSPSLVTWLAFCLFFPQGFLPHISPQMGGNKKLLTKCFEGLKGKQKNNIWKEIGLPKQGRHYRIENTLFSKKSFLLELKYMVLSGRITVHILEFLVGNSSTSSGNFARDRALEEKNQNGLWKQREQEQYRDKREKCKESKVIEAHGRLLFCGAPGSNTETVFLNVLPY